MKNPLLLALLLIAGHVSAQENAFDYIVPSVRSEKELFKITGNALNGDICNQSSSYGSMKYQITSRYEQDGSVSYKIIYFGLDITYYEDRAYYVKFSGVNAQLSGYSQYELRSGIFFSQYVKNENFQALSGSNFIKVPSESYQTQSWTFTNPKSNQTVNATSYYKNMLFAGQDRRILIVEYNENGKISKEYFLKHFGLVARQNEAGEIYVVGFKDFNLYSKSFIDSKSDKELREFAWDIIDRMRAIDVPDSFYLYTNSNQKKMIEKLDSLNGLLEQMMLKNPSMNNVNKYLLIVYTKSALDKLFDNAQKMDKISYCLPTLMRLLNAYFLARPYPESIPRSGLDTYFSGLNESYYTQYWKADYSMFRCINANADFTKNYKSYLMEPFVYGVLKGEGNMKNDDKCVLFSYVSNYYMFKEDDVNRYHYMVISVENYKYLEQKEKDMNIDYMRNVMKNFETLIPGNEADLNRAIDAVMGLNDYSNAVKIAENGYNNGIGKSLEFAFKYAEASYNNELDIENLKTAMHLMDGKLELMSMTQLENYIKYCKALNSGFDCSKAQSTLEKKRKKEQKSNKSKSSGSYSSSSKRAMNFAVLANPFAGLNTGKGDRIFKFLPMSATLRIKGTLHEFRYNPFYGFDAKNRFVGGKLEGSEINLNAGWKNLKGADYGYSLIFAKNEISSYSKSCTSIGGGLNVIYGNFSSDPEAVVARINGNSTNLLLNPKITRYEGLFTFSMYTFNWKSHVSGMFYYGVGAGVRQLTYGDPNHSEEELSDATKTVFEDKRFDQVNWTGAYFTFRMGFRFGLTLF
jgi:hypothetical protein